MIDWKDPKKEMPVFDTVGSPTLVLLTKLPGSNNPIVKLGYAIEEDGKVIFKFSGLWNTDEGKMVEEVIAWSEVNSPNFVKNIFKPDDSTQVNDPDWVDDIRSFWNNYDFKKSVLTLIRAHYEKNEEAFEKECKNIAKSFYNNSESELCEYVVVQMTRGGWFVGEH